MLCIISISDSLSYKKIFQYLNENLGFDPLIIHTDYEVSLALAIKESKFFSNKVLHIRCLFHLIKAIRDKCKRLGLCNKKLSKEMYAVIKNIEIICFIQKDKIKEYQKFLINNLKKNIKYTKLVTYLKNYWFKKSVEEYNFSEFINKYKTDKDKLNKLYITNNIVESIHGKLNYFLPKKITNQNSFIKSIKNIFINDFINNSSIIRYDYKIRGMILLIEKENINNEFKWITYDLFKKYLNVVMKSENNKEIINSNNDESEKLIQLIEGNIYNDNKTINKNNNDKSISGEDDESEYNDLDNNIIENDKNEDLLNKNTNGKDMNYNEDNNFNLWDIDNSNNVEECDIDIGYNINDEGNNLSYDINNNLEDMISVLNNLKIRNKDTESKKSGNNIDIDEVYINKEYFKPLKERINKK